MSLRARTSLLLWVGAAALPVARSAFGQAPVGIFIANVADASTNKPVPDALVAITDIGRSVRTDWLGEAHIVSVPAGRHTIIVRHIGYVPATVEIAFTRDTVSYVFMLAPSPPVLDTVRATANAGALQLKLHDFEIRRAMGIGRFLTDSVLQREHGQPIATIIARHVPGPYSTGLAEGLMREHAGGNCRPDVYIDDVRYGLTPSQSASIVPPSDALDLRSMYGDDVAGVEYYTEASAPARYRRAGMLCGVVLIWLRP